MRGLRIGTRSERGHTLEVPADPRIDASVERTAERRLSVLRERPPVDHGKPNPGALESDEGSAFSAASS
jgi:hypothetical protein